MKRGPSQVWIALKATWHDLWPVVVDADRVANAAAFGDGRMTLSARTGLACRRGKRWARIFRVIIEAMPWFGPGHCEKEAAKWEAAH